MFSTGDEWLDDISPTVMPLETVIILSDIFTATNFDTIIVLGSRTGTTYSPKSNINFALGENDVVELSTSSMYRTLGRRSREGSLWKTDELLTHIALLSGETHLIS